MNLGYVEEMTIDEINRVVNSYCRYIEEEFDEIENHQDIEKAILENGILPLAYTTLTIETEPEIQVNLNLKDVSIEKSVYLGDYIYQEKETLYYISEVEDYLECIEFSKVVTLNIEDEYLLN